MPHVAFFSMNLYLKQFVQSGAKGDDSPKGATDGAELSFGYNCSHMHDGSPGAKRV
jgi:hypothetical protein